VGVLLILTAIGLFAGGLVGNGSGGGGIQVEDGDYVPPPSQRTVNIPAVSGMAWTHAQRRLDELGLEATRRSEHSDITPEGSVIRQYPPAGDSVAEGTVVEVYTSEGPDFPVSVGSIAVYRDRDGEALNMRQEPWGPVVGKLPYGARIEVLQIDTNTDPGWVKGQSLSSGTIGWMAVRNPSDSYQLLYPER
jgi:beta-lactam-binding protein with PASTA domain